MEQFINKLKAALQNQLPGPDAQYLMAPMARPKTDISSLKPDQYKPSAVMILFCRDEQYQWFLPLTLRFSYKGAHSGQVSLPGGKADPADGSLQNTALRECYEEIGVKDEVEVLGSLTQLYIPVSGFLVAPFVGVCKRANPDFVPNAREVKSILKLKVEELLDAATVKQGGIVIEGNPELKMEAPYFVSGTYQVWGATAMILSELKALLAAIS